MKLLVKTENASYLLDKGQKTYRQECVIDGESVVTEGRLVSWPNIVIGRFMVLGVNRPFTFVITTKVVEVKKL